MIIGHEDGFDVGSGRYGSRENAPIGKTAMVEDFKCPQCGDSGRIQVDLKRGICVDCAQKMENAEEKGQSFKCDQCKDEFWTRQSLAEHKANVHGSRSNSAFRCEKCGHAKANHSGEGCDRGDCDCNGFSDTRENADPIARHENARAAGQDRYGSQNVNDETVTCHMCGDRERRGVADLTSKGWLCEACQKKWVDEMTKD